MSYKKVEMYTIECDNCKKISGEDSEYSCWNSEQAALEDAEIDNWLESEGKHYCKECYSIGDKDELIINENRKDLHKK